MLLDLNGQVLINPINQTDITDNWKEYINFKKNTQLCFVNRTLSERTKR